MVGTEFTVSVILNPALDRLDQPTWLKTMPVLAQAFGRAMPFWYGLGLLLIGAETYRHWGTGTQEWLGIAVLLWAASIVYSVTMLVPINKRIADMSAGSASATNEDHERWDALHRWRVVLLLAAIAFLLTGIA
jgi:hypothetical protein